jgi:hypothetical protein
MDGRVPCVDAESFVPTVRDWNEVWINRCAKAHNDVGQRVFEVFVFATPETMPFHHYTAAEKFVVLKQLGRRFGLFPGEDASDDRMTLCVHVL